MSPTPGPKVDGTASIRNTSHGSRGKESSGGSRAGRQQLSPGGDTHLLTTSWPELSTCPPQLPGCQKVEPCHVPRGERTGNIWQTELIFTTFVEKASRLTLLPQNYPVHLATWIIGFRVIKMGLQP